MGSCRAPIRERFTTMTKTMKTFAAAVLVGAVLLAGCAADEAASDAVIQTVTPEAAAKIIAEDADVVILDIRTPGEFAEAFISGATTPTLLVDFYAATFADDLDELDKDVHYVVYCRTGNRTGQSMSIFRDLGFKQVSEIGGGIVAWANADLPIVVP